MKQKGETINNADVATSFQNSVVEVLVGKTIAACNAYHVQNLIVAGGVASNKGLRQSLNEACKENNISLTILSSIQILLKNLLWKEFNIHITKAI